MGRQVVERSREKTKLPKNGKKDKKKGGGMPGKKKNQIGKLSRSGGKDAGKWGEKGLRKTQGFF